MDNILKNNTIIGDACVTPFVTYHVNDQDSLCNATLIVPENGQSSYAFIVYPGSVVKTIDLICIVEKNASLRVELLVAHADATITLTCIMRGESSHAVVKGVYLTGGTNSVKFFTKQHHEAAHSVSDLVIKGVVDQSASVSYAGMVRVEKEARCSTSCQDHKAIVLHEQARVVSVPSLEVLTDDVRCFHGSAIGQFDQEQLFYAASRALEPTVTKRLLLHAFFAHLFTNQQMNMMLKELL